jgi:hypothetical protein
VGAPDGRQDSSLDRRLGHIAASSWRDAATLRGHASLGGNENGGSILGRAAGEDTDGERREHGLAREIGQKVPSAPGHAWDSEGRKGRLQRARGKSGNVWVTGGEGGGGDAAVWEGICFQGRVGWPGWGRTGREGGFEAGRPFPAAGLVCPGCASLRESCSGRRMMRTIRESTILARSRDSVWLPL